MRERHSLFSSYYITQIIAFELSLMDFREIHASQGKSLM